MQYTGSLAVSYMNTSNAIFVLTLVSLAQTMPSQPISTELQPIRHSPHVANGTFPEKEILALFDNLTVLSRV